LHLNSFQQPAKNILFTEKGDLLRRVDRLRQAGVMGWCRGVMSKTQHSSSPVLQHSIVRVKY
jgi:3-phenylpropionate/cinnamic acid dioxygenase small subunit